MIVKLPIYFLFVGKTYKLGSTNSLMDRPALQQISNLYHHTTDLLEKLAPSSSPKRINSTKDYNSQHGQSTLIQVVDSKGHLEPMKSVQCTTSKPRPIAYSLMSGFHSLYSNNFLVVFDFELSK